VPVAAAEKESGTTAMRRRAGSSSIAPTKAKSEAAELTGMKPSAKAQARAEAEAKAEQMVQAVQPQTAIVHAAVRGPSECGEREGVAVVVDQPALEAAVRAMLSALGEDVTREGIADTPKRVAKAMAFAVRGYGMSAVAHVSSALFHEPGLQADEETIARSIDVPFSSTATRPGVVLIRDIPFFSTAEDNLLPFYGRCHVGYVPARGSIVGLSKVARVAEVFARRMQTPNRLAADIAAALDQGGAASGV